MTFRKRGYQELVDDILTELTGGVINEPITFRATGTAPPAFPLENAPVARIASVTGIADGEFRQFSDTDFELTGDRFAIRWLGGTRPDEGSTFHVDYYPKAANSPITDRNVGSVARTLVEAIGREIATLYEYLDLVYRSGFVDLAEGTALDYVVAILGLTRIRAGREVGEVVFARSTPAPGDITIPAGTVVATPPQGDKSEVFEFETTASRTLRQGQMEIAAPIRFRPTPEQQAAFTSGRVPAGAISLVPKPVVGIETVKNPEATARGAQDENDDQLRQRAKKALAEAGKSTVDALRAAVLRYGPDVSVVVQDMPSGVPGEVSLVISGTDDPQRRAAILQSVLATKAAGVMILPNYSEKVKITLKLRLETREDAQLSGDETRRIEAAVKSAVAGYVNGLKAGEDISRNALVALCLSDPRLRNVAIEALTAQRPGLPDDTALRLRDAGGGTAGLAGFHHVNIAQMEKAETSQDDVAVSIVAGIAEVTTAVRITATLAGLRTAAGIERDIQAPAVKPQIETLVRSFVESAERQGTIRLAELVGFIEKGSGLFTLKYFPDSSFVAEHLGTGQVDRNVDLVSIAEKERAELASLVLSLV